MWLKVGKNLFPGFEDLETLLLCMYSRTIPVSSLLYYFIPSRFLPEACWVWLEKKKKNENKIQLEAWKLAAQFVSPLNITSYCANGFLVKATEPFPCVNQALPYGSDF